jgi:MoxR-like ATPase
MILDPLTPAEAALLERAAVRTLADAAALAARLQARCRAAVQGRDDVIDLVITALLADGHVLLEDYPGSGKTTLAKALGESIVGGAEHPEDGALASFRRVQFTPDLLPADITGVTIFDRETSRFSFHPGPVFSFVLLADEINRTSPKVQAALLEAMGEKQVTVDNKTHALDELFFVIATQNPLDMVGTYPLPLAQLDRFLFKIRMTHLAREAELEVLATWRRHRVQPAQERVSRDDLIAARLLIHRQIQVARPIHEALVDLAGRVRQDRRVLQGISTRSLVLAVLAMQARAMTRGRDFVSADDLSALAIPLFTHRLEAVPGVEDPAAIVRDCVEAPLERLARASLRG